jgi:hypothetical protein
LSSEKPQLVTVRDGGDQAQYVADHVLRYREAGIALKSQAVLFRSSNHSAELELELTRRGIPFVKYGGLKFLEAAHIKDLLGILRWAENPRSRLSGFRTVKLLPGIGSATAARLLDPWEFAGSDRSDAKVRHATCCRVGLGFLRELFAILYRAKSTWPADMDVVVRWYEPHLQRIYEDAYVRQGDLLQMQQIASTYLSRERFLTEVTLDPPSATSDEAGVPGRDDDYLSFPRSIRQRDRNGRRSRFSTSWMAAFLGHEHRIQRRNRRGAAAAIRRHDASEKPPPLAGSTTLLHSLAIQIRRPPRLRGVKPVHTRVPASHVRVLCVAGRQSGE